MPRTDTHCSIPPILTASSRSMPFGATILRALAMIPAAFCRLNGLRAEGLSAAAATVRPPTEAARQLALKVAAERRKSRRRTPEAGSRTVRDFSRTFIDSLDMLISILEVATARPNSADSAHGRHLQRLCHGEPACVSVTC